MATNVVIVPSAAEMFQRLLLGGCSRENVDLPVMSNFPSRQVSWCFVVGGRLATVTSTVSGNEPPYPYSLLPVSVTGRC